MQGSTGFQYMEVVQVKKGTWHNSVYLKDLKFYLKRKEEEKAEVRLIDLQ